jgi:hypothetical protein
MAIIGKGEEITGDLYGIVRRLKAVDPDYFVIRAYRTGKFELHHRRNKGGSFTLTLPFDRLDARTVEYVRQTRRERAEALFAEIERHNERLGALS